MKRSFLFLCFFIISYVGLSAKNEIDSLLIELDNKIKNASLYIDLKDLKIEELKSDRIKYYTSIEKVYLLNMAIYNEYKSYVSDSAVQYLNYNMDIGEKLKDPYKLNETLILTARLFGRLGMYKEAIDAGNKVKREYLNKDQLIDYYSAFQYVYSGLGIYTQNSRDRSLYWKQHNAYRDTIIGLANSNSEEYLRIHETALRESDKLDEALNLNSQRLGLTKMGTPDYALVAFHRSLIFRRMGDVDNEKKFLILSAISDIQSAIKDNASISMLAQILMKEGDVDRAYTYVRFSFDNVSAYNTRLRSSEILNIQCVIDKAYQSKSDMQKQELRMFLILTSILSVLLIISVFYVYKQMRKGIVITKRQKETNAELNRLNSKLYSMNEELKKINFEVTEANYIKEEYIGYFLSQCSGYIDKMDEYRKMVNKKIQDRDIESLYKLTKRNDLKEEELKEFFINFDNIFTHLFPGFVDEFNSLLQDGEQIVLKKGEVLNTELRIYALIRLGINDSSKIASFLGYSVNTIYNYRAKIKNKAKILRDDFEWTVKKIGRFNK